MPSEEAVKITVNVETTPPIVLVARFAQAASTLYGILAVLLNDPSYKGTLATAGLFVKSIEEMRAELERVSPHDLDF